GRLQTVSQHAETVVDARQIRCREDFRILGPLGSDLIGECEGMSELPEIVVMHRGVEALARRVRRLAVVHLYTGVNRRLILDVKVDVYRSRSYARTQRRRDTPV